MLSDMFIFHFFKILCFQFIVSWCQVVLCGVCFLFVFPVIAMDNHSEHILEKTTSTGVGFDGSHRALRKLRAKNVPNA